MNYERYIKELRIAHEEVDKAIQALEAIAARRGLNGAPERRGPGRPRKNVAIPQEAIPSRAGEKPDSAA